ncbi:MAG TPA: enoyl-CoA hydratase/isomerase family protein [Usitatibacter sp.]|nr:enoyl-CoA hydratase/isomerase family protein [Usitatibacter sp.]
MSIGPTGALQDELRGKDDSPHASAELLAQTRGGVATVTLNRPRVLNALSFGMLRQLALRLDEWEHDERVRAIVLRGAGGKAFCAGGDMRAFYEGYRSGPGPHDAFFVFEYTLDYRIHTYPKPIVAVLDGIVMGGGMGLSQGARLRVVGDRTKMAMPETAIGLFPDVGASWFLSRCPGELGTYLGLAGVAIGAADAIYCGLADTHVGSELPAPELEPLRPAIDRHFGHDSVAAILGSLEAEDRPELRAWAGETLRLLRSRSPTMLVVTLEQLRRGRKLALGDCLRMELGLMHACFEQGDCLEGIRAVLVDKDNRPRWNPPGLADVDPDTIRRFFAPRWQAASHPLANLP